MVKKTLTVLPLFLLEWILDFAIHQRLCHEIPGGLFQCFFIFPLGLGFLQARIIPCFPFLLLLQSYIGFPLNDET